VTRCRSAVCPWPENENLPLLPNASYSPRGRIYGLPTISLEPWGATPARTPFGWVGFSKDQLLGTLVLAP